MSDLTSDSDIERDESSSDISCLYSSSDVEEDIEDNAMTVSVHMQPRPLTRRIHGVDRDIMEPYGDEPMASPQWLESYHSRKQENEKEMANLQKRLDQELPLSAWCKCGNCAIDKIENLKECKCCTEFPKCMDALEDKWVKEECEDRPLCITQHPGFQAVSLQHWSLRLAADKYRTLKNKKYTNLGKERRFLRAVAYREFTRLIYGHLGNKWYSDTSGR